MSTLPTLALWRVRPVEPPALLKRCPRCGERRPFRSSGRFRINAQGRRLDIWLIYRCESCDQTHNRTVHSRVPPERLCPTRYAAYLANDEDVAREVGFGPCDMPTRATDDFVLDISQPSDRFRLDVPWPLRVRLDRVLARGLGWSRSTVRTAVRDGRLAFEGSVGNLSSPPPDGLIVIHHR